MAIQHGDAVASDHQIKMSVRIDIVSDDIVIPSADRVAPIFLEPPVAHAEEDGHALRFGTHDRQVNVAIAIQVADRHPVRAPPRSGRTGVRS